MKINDSDQIISMTELQKLSLKKLRELTLPLFVLDQKSKKKGFVILDVKSFEKTIRRHKRNRESTGVPMKRIEETPGYRSMGLLWDRLDLSNEQFQVLLKDPNRGEHLWAVKRLLEYAPSTLVTRVLSLSELQEVLKRIRLRPIFQEAWRHAVYYWSKNP